MKTNVQLRAFASPSRANWRCLSGRFRPCVRRDIGIDSRDADDAGAVIDSRGKQQKKGRHRRPVRISDCRLVARGRHPGVHRRADHRGAARHPDGDRPGARRDAGAGRGARGLSAYGLKLPGLAWSDGKLGALPGCPYGRGARWPWPPPDRAEPRSAAPRTAARPRSLRPRTARRRPRAPLGPPGRAPDADRPDGRRPACCRTACADRARRRDCDGRTDRSRRRPARTRCGMRPDCRRRVRRPAAIAARRALSRLARTLRLERLVDLLGRGFAADRQATVLARATATAAAIFAHVVEATQFAAFVGGAVAADVTVRAVLRHRRAPSTWPPCAGRSPAAASAPTACRPPGRAPCAARRPSRPRSSCDWPRSSGCGSSTSP